MRNIYVASSIKMYNTLRYDEIKKVLLAMFPDDTLLFAKGMYSCANDWLTLWPIKLKEIDLLIACPTKENTVGKGVYTEVKDCLREGKPCYKLTNRNVLLPLELDHMQIINQGRNWAEYAKVNTSIRVQ